MSFYLKVIRGVCSWGIFSFNHLRIEGDRLNSTLFSLFIFPIHVSINGSAVHIYVSMVEGRPKKIPYL